MHDYTCMCTCVETKGQDVWWRDKPQKQDPPRETHASLSMEPLIHERPRWMEGVCERERERLSVLEWVCVWVCEGKRFTRTNPPDVECEASFRHSCLPGSRPRREFDFSMTCRHKTHVSLRSKTFNCLSFLWPLLLTSILLSRVIQVIQADNTLDSSGIRLQWPISQWSQWKQLVVLCFSVIN